MHMPRPDFLPRAQAVRVRGEGATSGHGRRRTEQAGGPRPGIRADDAPGAWLVLPREDPRRGRGMAVGLLVGIQRLDGSLRPRLRIAGDPQQRFRIRTRAYRARAEGSGQDRHARALGRGSRCEARGGGRCRLDAGPSEAQRLENVAAKVKGLEAGTAKAESLGTGAAKATKSPGTGAAKAKSPGTGAAKAKRLGTGAAKTSGLQGIGNAFEAARLALARSKVAVVL